MDLALLTGLQVLRKIIHVSAVLFTLSILFVYYRSNDSKALPS